MVLKVVAVAVAVAVAVVVALMVLELEEVEIEQEQHAEHLEELGKVQHVGCCFDPYFHFVGSLQQGRMDSHSTDSR